MREMFAVVLLMASTGMIYASFTAAAPQPGIDYDVPEPTNDLCPAQASPGDKFLSFVSSAKIRSEESPADSSGILLEYLTCRLLDTH